MIATGSSAALFPIERTSDIGPVNTSLPPCSSYAIVDHSGFDTYNFLARCTVASIF